eukprot:423609-Rhodomonas_salina.1
MDSDCSPCNVGPESAKNETFQVEDKWASRCWGSDSSRNFRLRVGTAGTYTGTRVLSSVILPTHYFPQLSFPPTGAQNH